MTQFLIDKFVTESSHTPSQMRPKLQSSRKWCSARKSTLTIKWKVSIYSVKHLNWILVCSRVLMVFLWYSSHCSGPAMCVDKIHNVLALASVTPSLIGSAHIFLQSWEVVIAHFDDKNVPVLWRHRQIISHATLLCLIAQLACFFHIRQVCIT